MEGTLCKISVFIFIYCNLNVDAQSRTRLPACPNRAIYETIPHMPCFFYACYRGELVSQNPFQCPDDPEYYNKLLKSGLQNPCITCPRVAPSTAATTPTTTVAVTTAPATTPPTTAAPTTSAATAATTKPAKDITFIASNAHVHGAVWVRSGTTRRECLTLCEETETCLGFDFDITDNSCWLHYDLRVCDPPIEKPNCTHFRLFDMCPPTTDKEEDTTAATTTTTTELPFTMSFAGYHIYDGTVMPLGVGMATAEVCVAVCRSDPECYGADFDTSTSSCWLHGKETECTELIPKPTCTHFRLKDICESTTVPVTTRVTSGPTTVSPGMESTTRVGETTTVEGDGSLNTPTIDVMPEGYFEAVEGYHIPGGMKMFGDVSLRQCLDACLITPYCLAIDYSEQNQACYFHFQGTYCAMAFELPGNMHFKRVACITDAANDAAAVWYHFHVQSGVEFCTLCTLGECMQACYADPLCAGIDFDIRNLGCYVFKSDNICGPLIPKDYCIHMSRDVCVPDAYTGISIDTLTSVVYPPPTGLPTGWLAYPGYRIRNGIQVGSYGMEADECISLCNKEASCASGNYDTSAGSCWLHVRDNLKCAQLEPSDTVYHFKKESCDTVIGTLQPYVNPLWTSP